MTKKILLVLLLGGLLLAVGTPVMANQEFRMQIKKLVSGLTTKTSGIKSGYIVKKTGNRIYINVGHRVGVQAGDEFKIIRQQEVLTDPLTGVVLGKVTQELAKVRVTQVKESFSIAKIESYYTPAVLQVMDKAVFIPYRVGVLKFSLSGVPDKLKQIVHNYLINYLRRKNKFRVVSSKKVNRLADKLSKNGMISIASQKLISESLNLDLLITGEIYQGEKKIYVQGELYNKQMERVQNEKVITFAANNKLIDYYQARTDTEPRLLVSNKFDYQALSISVGNIDKDNELEIILTTNKGLKILTYQEDGLQFDRVIETYNRTKYDDYKIVTGNFAADSPAKIWGENFNQLCEFSWDKENYKKQKITDFNTHRPKSFAQIDQKNYLLTRDYHHHLRFNTLVNSEYKTKFKLQLDQNEGYRVGIGDLDKDKSQELVLTSYQDPNKYKVKIYGLTGKLEASLPTTYGAGVAILEFGSRSLVAVYTPGKKDQKVILYEYQQENYQKVKEISNFKFPIKALTVGNIKNKKGRELFVLTGNKKQSNVYIYQNLIDKTKNR